MSQERQKPKILIAGCNGLLGQKMTTAAGTRYFKVGADLQERSVGPVDEYLILDITERDAVLDTVQRIAPVTVVNAAALTNVDACEKEQDLAWKVNVDGVRHLLEACGRVGGTLIHMSSDYVFDGESGPYEEIDPPNPLGFYGKTKLESERVLAGSRTAWALVRTNVLYGWARDVRDNFALWVHSHLRARKYIRAAVDQYGNPTLADNLAEGLLSIITEGRRGLFHVAGADYMSRWAFALKIASVFQLGHDLIAPVLSSQLSQRAPRPHWGGLKVDRAVRELNFMPVGVQAGLEKLKAQIDGKETEVL